MHAYQRPAVKGKVVCGCEGDGHTKMPKSSNKKEGRVDQVDKGGWRGVQLDGCPATTVWLPTGDVLCPR